MAVLDRVLCPICKFPSGVPHCKNKHCIWRICTKCSKMVAVIFDYHERYFVWEKKHYGY